MSYFANGFMKAFVGTKEDQTFVLNTASAVDNGLLTTAGVQTAALGNAGAPNALGVGTYGFFNKNTYLSVNTASTEVTTGQSLILAGASLMTNDKIGPFHGGYAESNKSKMINPRLVSNFYKMTDAAPEQSIWHVGVTNFQVGTTVALLLAGAGYPTDGIFTNVATTVLPLGGTGMTVDITVIGGVVTEIVENQVGTGYSISDVITIADDAVTGVPTTAATATVTSVGAQDCEFEFLCGETYNLFINLNGAPVLRVLNHDSYRNLAAYTGCCPEGSITPTAVDSTLVMIDWAKQIIESPYLKDFIRPIVYDEAGNPWFATAAEAVTAGYVAVNPATITPSLPAGIPGSGNMWSFYTSTGHTEGALAGLRIIGAYVDTQFSTCSFQTSDYYNKEVVQMDISLRDESGDPCVFDGLCIETECCGFGGQGFGNTYVRELILAESYLQNFRSTDPRIREITQGDAFTEALPVAAFYTKYVIQHVVPRYNNPSSVHDDDQYNLCIYVPSGVVAAGLETFMEEWLVAAGNPLGATLAADGIESFDHVACPVTAI
jgi:hypothetical protein